MFVSFEVLLTKLLTISIIILSLWYLITVLPHSDSIVKGPYNRVSKRLTQMDLNSLEVKGPFEPTVDM